MSSAIVFGASRGIGRMIASHFDERGWSVTRASRSGAPPADVADEAAVRRVFANHQTAFGSAPDAVVNTAALQGPIGPAWTLDSNEWAEVVRTNLVGAFIVTKCAVEAMLPRGSGSIIQLSGGGAAFGRPHFSSYGASKAGLLRLVETVAGELLEAGQAGIIINAIAPGGVKTDMTEEVLRHAERAGAKEAAQAEEVMRSGGTPPALIAALVDFLCDGAAARGISGRLFHVKDDYIGFASATDVPNEAGKLRRVPLERRAERGGGAPASEEPGGVQGSPPIER